MKAILLDVPGLRVVSRRAGEQVRLVVEGTFDLPAAVRVAGVVRAQAAGARLKIDLRRAHIDDVALAALARTAGRGVAVVGLSRHHERLLRYLAGEGPGAAAAEVRE